MKKSMKQNGEYIHAKNYNESVYIEICIYVHVYKREKK